MRKKENNSLNRGGGKKRRDVYRGKILGPVEKLEDYVHPEWWRYLFNSLYLKTDADVVDDENITKSEIDLFTEILRLSPEDKILDLCCGQGRHSLELARRGFSEIEGVDRSHYLIQKAKARATKEGLKVRFREGDARKLPYPPDSFDVVLLLGNSFGYFETISDDIRVLKEVFRVLKPYGRLLIDVADGEYVKNNFQPRSWEWISKKYFVCRERSLSSDKQRLISREVVTHVEKGVIVDQFYAERLYTKESIKELLKGVGFSNVVFHGKITPDSIRNQDLGMMERRIIVTALVKKEWSRGKKRKDKKNVVVLLGDPRKPDPVKPSQKFDDDDFYTINRLKDALRALEDYNFIYFDNHDTLIYDLMKHRAKLDFVFNLCDEGFNNVPTMELHVPAILEVLKVPYTGSGPQTLAYCYDKSLVRGVAKELEIPVPQAFFIKPGDTVFELPFPFPVIVKPNLGDASFAITQKSVVNNPEELVNIVSDLREKLGYDYPIIVEEFLPGNDLSVGIIGNPLDEYTILPIIEEDYSSLPQDLPKICGYEAKWLPDTPYWNIKSKPANIEESVRKEIERYSLQLFERLGCRDYCRLDWRLDSVGNPKLLEVNPNPGWCWDGHLAKMAKIAGLAYADMLRSILNAAERRLKIYK